MATWRVDGQEAVVGKKDGLGGVELEVPGKGRLKRDLPGTGWLVRGCRVAPWVRPWEEKQASVLGLQGEVTVGSLL